MKYVSVIQNYSICTAESVELYTLFCTFNVYRIIQNLKSFSPLRWKSDYRIANNLWLHLPCDKPEEYVTPQRYFICPIAKWKMQNDYTVIHFFNTA